MEYYDWTSLEWVYEENKVLLFGGTGGIGTKLRNYLARDFNVLPLGSREVDVTDQDKVSKVIGISEPDIIINMSGFNYDSFFHKFLMNDKNLKRMIDVNIWGNINILKAALPIFRKKEFGRVIIASSILSNKTILGTSIYSACKSFVDSLVRVVAAENGKYNITINSLRMGYMDAGLTYKIPPGLREKIKKAIPGDRFGEIADLYNLIKCIIGTQFINGSNIIIDGAVHGI